VWKHTLADLFPPSPETPLQNQEVKSFAFRLLPLNVSGYYPGVFPIAKDPLSVAVSECSFAVQIAADNLNFQPIKTPGGMYDRAG